MRPFLSGFSARGAAPSNARYCGPFAEEGLGFSPDPHLEQGAGAVPSSKYETGERRDGVRERSEAFPIRRRPAADRRKNAGDSIHLSPAFKTFIPFRNKTGADYLRMPSLAMIAR